MNSALSPMLPTPRAHFLVYSSASQTSIHTKIPCGFCGNADSDWVVLGQLPRVSISSQLSDFRICQAFSHVTATRRFTPTPHKAHRFTLVARDCHLDSCCSKICCLSSPFLALSPLKNAHLITVDLSPSLLDAFLYPKD